MAEICQQCYFVSGYQIDQCKTCQIKFIIQDNEEDQINQNKIKKTVFQLTKKQIKKIKGRIFQNQLEKRERFAKKKLQIAQKKLLREQEIQQKKARQAQQQRLKKQKIYLQQNQTKYKNFEELLVPFSIYITIDRTAQNEKLILEKLIKRCHDNDNLMAYARKYNKIQKCSRGPEKILSNIVQYKKPIGYTGIPIEIKYPGNWLSCDRNNQEWVIAYHGTSLIAAQNIIKEGFKIGPNQQCQNQYNGNALSGLTNHVGKGIYCSPNITTAESYNKSRNYTCILQCRVNPYMLKIAQTSNYWVVNNPNDIIPYRVLLKKHWI